MPKYTLHPITSSGNRISMPWDAEEDPTQEQIDQYEKISAPEEIQSRPQMNFARFNGQDVPLDDVETAPKVESPRRDVEAIPQKENEDPLKDSPNLKRILFSQDPANESLAPDIKQPETYWGGFGKSLYDDYVKPMASAAGIAGMIGGESEVGAFKKSSIFNKLGQESIQATEDEGAGAAKPSISEMQKKLADILKNKETDDAMARKIANIKADPKFQKLPESQQNIVLDHVRNNPKVFTPKTPTGGVVEPPKVAPPTDQSFRFAPGQGAQPDRSLDIMKQPTLFNPNVHPGETGLPNVEPVTAANKVPRGVQQPILPGLEPKKSLWQKVQDKASIIHGSREIMASMDYSAPARQGAFLIGRKGYWKALPSMIKAGATQAGYDAIQETIESHPHFGLAEKTGVAFTDLGTNLSKREETFMSTLSNHVPLMKGSARAYTGFLNATRMNVFGDLVDAAKKAMPNHTEFQKALPYIADYVNTATGRGGLGRFEHSAKGLNTVFFAPRLMASRLKLLYPKTYLNPNVPAFVRKEALKDLLRFTGVAMSILGLAKAAGAEVEVDPRSADFGKVKIGDTRFDVAAGFTQYLRLAAGLGTYITDKVLGTDFGNMKSASTGKVRQFGETPVTPTALDSVLTFLKNKEAPIPSFITGFLSSKDIAGQPFDVPKEIGSRFTPMILQDAYDVFKTNPELLPMTIPASIVGVGIQSYKPRMQGSFFDAPEGGAYKKSFFDSDSGKTRRSTFDQP